jgi:hypothetical protein
MNARDNSPEYQLIQQRIEHERELREETAKQLKLALDLQAKEYERRLDDLNGAHKRAVEERGMFVKQDMYDARLNGIDDWKEAHNREQELWRVGHIKENDGWKLEVSNILAADRARDEQSRKSWTIVTVVVSLAINAIALILAFLIHASRVATP